MLVNNKGRQMPIRREIHTSEDFYSYDHEILILDSKNNPLKIIYGYYADFIHIVNDWPERGDLFAHVPLLTYKIL